MSAGTAAWLPPVFTTSPAVVLPPTFSQASPAVIYIHKPHDYETRSAFDPRKFFIGLGAVLLSVVSVLPIWNAITLLQDSNYVFWAGRGLPYIIIFGCIAIIVGYCASVDWLIRKKMTTSMTANGRVQIEGSMKLVFHVIVTLYGLFCIIVAVPLMNQTEVTSSILLHQCGSSYSSHRLYEYYQVLQNIRATPECARKVSVENCAGYRESLPYTEFLKGMENKYECSGFCSDEHHSVAMPPSINPQAFLMQGARGKFSGRAHTSQQMSLSLDSSDSSSSPEAWRPRSYPPTLFSRMNFQASCEGMAARDMQMFAGQIAQQMFTLGIYLICIAAITAAMTIGSFCFQTTKEV